MSAIKLILIPALAVAVSIMCRFGVEITIAFFGFENNLWVRVGAECMEFRLI